MSDQIPSEVATVALDDDEFIATFEQGGFDAGAFRHQAHIRMAWLYVRRLGSEAAIHRVAAGIQQLAKAHGTETVYHDTMTRAWVYIVADAIAKSPSASFTEFVAQNPQLLEKQLLLEYYSPAVLSSSQARATWVAPDLAPIPGAPASSVAGSDADPAPTVAAADYIAAFRAVPTAVAVMAATDGVNVHGMTASSVTSVSVDPALLLVCVQRGSRILPMIRASGHFSLSFLNDQQRDVASHFASPLRPAGASQFHGIPHRAGRFGLPILNGASAWLACELWHEYPGGDHVIVCGLVRDAFGGEAHPLLSYARQLL
ncbi:MAG: flavin reductase [Acetobacteraceae bacterium]|nr:flavin reductase [Acetobacteraceae bacterium]